LERIKSFKLRNFILLAFLIGIYYVWNEHLDFVTEKLGVLVKNHKEWIANWAIPISIIIGVTHSYRGKSKSDHVFKLNFFQSPILASTITALTYGVVIVSSIVLIYIITYDQQTLEKYPGVDRNTINCFLFVFFVWGVNGLVNMEKKISSERLIRLSGFAKMQVIGYRL